MSAIAIIERLEAIDECAVLAHELFAGYKIDGQPVPRRDPAVDPAKVA